ncbi:hypothetical protein BG011_008905 [Mortierella polycephala]|uniref:Uncharacterized protein n=1 Tax=Mortierella polycephala TaxID=41804 RepID=A0A9P6TX66_9FUNG|nr:hypothetical protein BG011_008905 [Mortierella polycephala]
MRFAAAASLLAFAATVLSEPWKNLGGDLALVGPSHNATFKVGDTIPFEYTFYTIKTVNSNNTGTTTTGTVSLTSLSWIGNTGNKTLEVALNNDRQSDFSAPCLQTDVCTGTYYPKRVDLIIPAESYPSNYTIVLVYSMTIANRTISTNYKTPVTLVPASANVTSPTAVIQGAPAVQVTLPVYEAPNGGLVAQVPKAIVGMTILLASTFLLL